MKKHMKTITSGIVVFLTLAAVTPAGAFAREAGAGLNSVRVNLEGATEAEIGESYELGSGAAVPYSILYEGTTYLPLRKIGELTGKQIHWNGDTRTVSLTEPLVYPTKSDPWAFRFTLAEREDLNGNLWHYNAVKDAMGNNYIHVVDYARDFSRVYRYSSGKVAKINGHWQESYDSVTDGELDDVIVSDGGIVFVTALDGSNRQIRKLIFESDADTQDGAVVSEGERYLLFGDLMIAFGRKDDEIGEKPVAEAINLKTGNRSAIGAGDFEGSAADAFFRAVEQDYHVVEYRDGYLFFDSYTPYVFNRHSYKVKIEMADTPVTGAIERLY